MQRAVLGNSPIVDSSAFVSEMAYLVGDVSVGEKSSIWPFVCLRGDHGPTDVGDRTNIQEFSMLHGATVGDDVSIGHNVVIDYATVEDNSLIGMSSTLQQGAKVESRSLIAAGSLVTENQTIPSETLAFGAPAETRPIEDVHRDVITETVETYVENAST